MLNRNISEKIKTYIFKDNSETIWVYLKDAKTKGLSYDPYLNTGYINSKQSPLPVNALVKQIVANSLIIRELGLSATGAIKIKIDEKDLSLIKLAEKIEYDGEDYSVYNKALGNKVQIYKKDFGFYEVILFRVK